MSNFILRKIDFYTDGSCSTKTQMGGWASLCIEDGDLIDTKEGYEPYTTNNRMELMAILSALENINTIETSRAEITIYCDSAYVVNCINNKWYNNWLTNGWRTSDKQEVKNQDLWSRILALYIKLNAKFSLSFVKVEGHTGNKWNEYADLLAKKQRQMLEQ